MTAPRPGSTIDRAQRALQSGPLPRAELARLIERDDDELDGLLRYGVRMGLLVRSNGDEDVSYALGDGVPVEVEARPAPGPMLASAAPAVASAPAAAPTAPAPTPVAPLPRPAPALTVTPAEREGLPPAVVAQLSRGARGAVVPASASDLQPSAYKPQPGSQASLLLAYLREHAPYGGSVWLSAQDLAASGADRYFVHGNLQTALKHGAAVTTKGAIGKRRFQAGPAAPAVLGVVPTLPATPAAPAPRPAAPAPDPAPAAETAAFLLKQLDGEIERLEYSLRIVRRRREEFAAAVKGARLAPPQHDRGTAAASVRGTTERTS